MIGAPSEGAAEPGVAAARAGNRLGRWRGLRRGLLAGSAGGLARRVALAIALALLVPARLAAAAPVLVPAAHAGRVSVRAEPGLESVARELASSAEATLTRISADLLELPTPRAIEVRLVRDASDLPAIAPAGRGAPPWAIGVAYPDLGIVSVALRRGAQVHDARATLRHELAHIALGAALGARAPRWLHEGFAYQHAGEWSWERTETLAAMAWSNNLIPLGELDASFPREELPASRAYAEAYDFVGFLSRRGRWDDVSDDGDRWPFRRFLRDVGHGSTLDQAATRAFGKPLAALFDEWRTDFGGRYMLVPMGLLGLLLWTLCALLLALAWWRRRRQNRARLAAWELEDARRRDEAARAAATADPDGGALPFVAWPGIDPLAGGPRAGGPRAGGPRAGGPSDDADAPDAASGADSAGEPADEPRAPRDPRDPRWMN